MSILTNGFWLGDLSSFDSILKLEDSIQKRMDSAVASGQKFDLYTYDHDNEDDDEYVSYQVTKGIAVIPVNGNLTTKETWLSNLFGMSTYEGISRMLNHAAENAEVNRIVMDLDTPGGSSVGIDELGLLINKIDSELKPVHGYTSGLANSAGYWMISACRDVTCTKMSNLGSIGVVTIHQEISKMLKDRGVEVTVFRDGKFKSKPNSYEKLDKETKDMVNGSLKLLGNFFLDWVAEQRNFNRDTVRADVGEGRVFFGEEAVANGLADRIMFFEDFIYKLSLLDSIEPDTQPLSRMKTAEFSSAVNLNTEILDEVDFSSSNNLTEEDIDMSVKNDDKPSKTAGKKIQTANGEMTLEQAEAAVELGALELTEELRLAMDAVRDPKPVEEESDADLNSEAEENNTEEESSADLSSENETEEGGDPVVAHVQTELTEQISANTKLQLELETVKAKLSSQDDTVTALSQIAMNSCQKMNLAMGGAQIDLSAMDTATLLNHHNKLAEQFTTTFKIGGVAAVESVNEHADDKVTEQFVAPKSTVEFSTSKS